MRVRLIAVGTRLPAWVDAGFADYQRRLRGAGALELVEIPLARRAGDGGAAAARALEAEAARILARLEAREFVVALEERGQMFTTLQLRDWLAARRRDGAPLAFIIGGPDGLAAAVLARSQLRWSLAPLTFPHGLVRVLLAEQLYRASTLLAGHPYHRP
jgi:23S rRNA (pseudouridine1915-N3)-methyltransferase